MYNIWNNHFGGKEMETLLSRLRNGEQISGKNGDGWKYNAVLDMPAYEALKVWAIAPDGGAGFVVSLLIKDFPETYGKIDWN